MGTAKKPGKGALSPAQCRAARGLLEWTQAKLAEEAGVGLSTVKDFETEKREPLPHNIAAITNALVQADVMLIDPNGHGAGVRLAKKGKK